LADNGLEAGIEPASLYATDHATRENGYDASTRPVLEPEKSEKIRSRHPFHLQKSLNGAAVNCV
jgi:hypothetical protein